MIDWQVRTCSFPWHMLVNLLFPWHVLVNLIRSPIFHVLFLFATCILLSSMVKLVSIVITPVGYQLGPLCDYFLFSFLLVVLLVIHAYEVDFPKEPVKSSSHHLFFSFLFFSLIALLKITLFGSRWVPFDFGSFFCCFCLDFEWFVIGRLANYSPSGARPVSPFIFFVLFFYKRPPWLCINHINFLCYIPVCNFPLTLWIFSFFIRILVLFKKEQECKKSSSTP